MAEAFAVVAIVASIVQLVDAGTKVVHLLNEFHSDAGDIPESFRHVKVELPVLLDTLQQTKETIEAGSVREETKKALLPVIEGCQVQISSLGDVLTKALPAKGDTRSRITRKALWMGLRYGSKVETITTRIRKYIQTLTYYHAAASSTLAPSAALVGLGGVGKSQLAIECAYRVRDDLPDTWVFWVHAGNTARLKEGYQRIADVVDLPGRNNQGADIPRLTFDWLCDETNGRWFMVLDNVDDPDGLFGKAGTDATGQETGCFANLLPQSSNGSILITSRRRDVSYRLTERVSDVVQVGPMDQSDSLTLFKKKLDGDYDTDDGSELIQILDYMPLAIAQAAAYINQRAPLTTVSKYLHDIRKSDGDRSRLLQQDAGDTRRDGTASNSILTTWQISFDYIRKERPPAARLLSLMCLFDRQGIPHSLLESRYLEDGDIESNFEEDMYTLCSYSLVGMNLEGTEFEMHRLVQFSMKKWLSLHGELEDWKERYIGILDDTFPRGEFENWETCQPLYPHAEVVLAYQPLRNSCILKRASILTNAAVYASEKGSYGTAVKMLRESLDAREKVLGAENHETVATLHHLAMSLEDSGGLKEAESLYRRVIDIRERLLGKEDVSTVGTSVKLTRLLRAQGRYKEADIYRRRVLDFCERSKWEGDPQGLETKDPKTRDPFSELVYVIMKGRPEEAEVILRQAFAETKKDPRMDYQVTLKVCDSLAKVLYSQSKYEEAEAITRQALAYKEKLLGRNHPRTLDTLGRLAVSKVKQGNLEEAKDMFRGTMDGMEEVLGAEHPGTLQSIVNYAIVLEGLEGHEAALPYYQRASIGLKKAVDPTHPARVACDDYFHFRKRKLEANGGEAAIETEYLPRAVGRSEGRVAFLVLVENAESDLKTSW
ncbi:hypothetical protein FQN54_009538 [Arachnomyces sp. PD_36]|nr:hypothetical protein FQN54_009538 [Arachnomyces sp. PD_36]